MDAKLRFAQVLVAMLCVVVIAERAMGDDDDGIMEIVLFRKTPETRAREERIAAELAKLDAARLPAGDWAKEFAGAYYTDGGPGQVVAITVAPKAGISYQVYGCLGLYEADHGDIVKVTPEGIKVKWAIPPDNDPKRLVSSNLYFVRWGSRRYLVPERQMLALVTDYNKGGLQRARLWSIPLKFTSEADDAAARKAPAPPGRPQL